MIIVLGSQHEFSKISNKFFGTAVAVFQIERNIRAFLTAAQNCTHSRRKFVKNEQSRKYREPEEFEDRNEDFYVA